MVEFRLNMVKIERIKKEHHKLAQAIKFLVDKVLDEEGNQKESIRTSKPLVIHSIETAFYLKQLGYENDIVVSAVLHDLLEDTDTQKEEITEKFGKKVADIVEAVSYDFGINKNADYKKSFDELADFLEALIVKSADLLENIKYFQFASDNEKPRLLKKWNYFLKISQKISKERVYKELEKSLKEL